MLNIDPHEQPAAAQRAMIEAELRRWVSGGGDLMEAICAEALFPPGKLLRPVLCLSSALAAGGTADAVLPIAAALELVHVASLIHDDIVDQDAMRRGRPSVPHRHGIDDALLAGDGLLARTFLALVGAWDAGVPAERMMPAVRVLARALQAECRAALLEALLRRDLSIDVEVCLDVIRGKTAALMQAACEIGGIVAGAPPAHVQALRRYGEALGMAFQIRDDLLSYTSDAHTIGKPITSDAQNLYPTLPVLLARDLAGDADRRHLTELFADPEDPATAHRELCDLLVRTGAVEETTRRARAYATHARELLAELPPSPSRDQLAELVTTAADRDR
jgi:geranylgeranyl diphosphate synthase type I